MGKITKNNFRPNVEYDENFKPINKHVYQPWLNLNKEQMADPFGWLQSQNVNVRALLKQMKLDDRWIDNILRGNPPREDMKQHYDKDRLSVGQKAIQFYQKQQLLHGLNEGRKVKLNEQQLRQVIKEAISEIGNTPAGQWMLGRLAGRQQNRAQGKEPGWNTRYGKIKNTTTDAAQYAKNQQLSYDDLYSFSQGKDLENDDWARNADSSLNQDQEWGDVQGYGNAMKNMIRYQAAKNGFYNRISESKLKSIISKAIKESLHGGDEYIPQADEFYVCSETDYNSGSVDAWIGDKEDADYCEQSSEGSAIGPFKTYGDAVHYANTNGIEIRDPYERSHNPEDDSDYYNKLSKSEMQGDDISRLYNNYSLTGQLPSDEDVKRVEKISESKLKSIISKAMKQVLKEGYSNTVDVYKVIRQNYLQRVLSSNKYRDYDWMAGNNRGTSLYPGKIVAFGSVEEAKRTIHQWRDDWVVLKITVNREGVSNGRNCILVEPSAIINISQANSQANI